MLLQALHLTTRTLWPQHKNKHVEIQKGKKRKEDIEEAQDWKNKMAGSSLGFLISPHIFQQGAVEASNPEPLSTQKKFQENPISFGQ